MNDARRLMHFGKIVLNPSWTRPFTYQGQDLSGASGIFGCPGCKASVAVPFTELLNGEHSLETDTEDALYELFDIPIVGKSHDGGWPVFENVACGSCGERYIAYIGVNETSNSVYRVTLQGVVQCDN